MSYRMRQDFDGVSEPSFNGGSKMTLVHDNTSWDRDRSDSGCYIKASTGFVLVFLAVAIAVGVGVIVAFAGPQKDGFTCNCGDSNGNGNSQGQVGCPTIPPTEEPTPCPEVPCPTCPSMTPGTGMTSQMTSAAGVTTTTMMMPTTTSMPMPESARLPRHLVPIHYDVKIRPDIFHASPLDFSNPGYVKMTFRCVMATNNITLHINKINVTRNTIHVMTEDGSAGPNVTMVTEDSRLQFIIIQVNTTMSVGRTYHVEMNFTGEVNNDLDGLYYSSFKRDNKDTYLAITQFQPTDARKAFPCMDEPGLKATFNITMERRTQNNYITLSNMPIIDTYNSTDGFVADVYQITPIMPTYLLAFSVNDFVYEKGMSDKNVTFRSYAQNEDFLRLNYSRDVGIKILEAFEGYFEIDYPLPKVDQIAIPDFSAGAMENWGLITYRSTYLLYDANLTTSAQELRIVEIITHELAHMWFGNIISPAWWDDLWLNEGFASFLESVGMNLIHPEWKVFDWFGIYVMHGAFRADSLPTSRPIYKMVEFPGEINSLFDTITYSKGASVIRMMWHFLGEETFRLGLKSYINANLYGSVTHDELWEALSNETRKAGGAGVDVKAIMDTWILQRNYPIVMVTREGGNIRIRQERYVIGNTTVDLEPTSPFHYEWNVPFTFTYEGEADFNKTSDDVVWLYTSDPNKQITASIGLNDWILGNIQQNGYYRVNYETENWDKLITQLKTDHTVIHGSNRAQLIDDIWALQQAQKVSISHALQIFEYLRSETEYSPWYAALSELSFLERMIRRRASYGTFEKMMRYKLEVIFKSIGMMRQENENINVRLLRSYIVQEACQFHIENCTRVALEEFNKWRNDTDNYFIDPDIKPTVLCTAVRETGSDEWDFLFEHYQNSTASEQTIIRGALACSRQDWILNRFLDYSIDETKIRKQDARLVIQSVGANPAGLYKAWSFVINNWNYLLTEYGLGFGSLNRILSSLTASFHTEFEKSQVEYLRRIHPADESQQVSFDATLASIDNNIEWAKNNMAAVEDWLTQFEQYP
ncbi:hypothetical protein FSP39_013558 [Pinctada imbricata]|uniref:Aminopeptidase n=1 Tax=Pinctada imbricata TaxID=66713 RepID=A0AA89CAV8_PINIB|nr:hypothetical protein FSP39_013558 [Pinctada imbricata]